MQSCEMLRVLPAEKQLTPHVCSEGARSYRDAALLFWCMDILEIDQDKLSKDDPLLFRELQGYCTLCRNKDRCSRDIAHHFAGRWSEWHAYCPNSATLVSISAAQ